MKHIYLFCDGSSLGNPGYGGWASILRYKDTQKIICGSQENATNNQMELKAVVEALKILKEPCFVELLSDSSYVVKGINEWLQNWVKKDFKNVKNIPLWKEYLHVSTSHKVKASWVKGHSGHEQNEQCDTIARQEAQKLKEKKESC